MNDLERHFQELHKLKTKYLVEALKDDCPNMALDFAKEIAAIEIILQALEGAYNK